MSDTNPAAQAPAPQPGTRRRWLIALAAALAVILAVLLPRLLAPAKTELAKPLAPVILQPATLGVLDREFTFSGNLKPESSTTVIPKVPGKVVEVLVKEGQEVREGQLLVRMEENVVRLQMEQAEAAYNAALAQYQKADTGVRPEELASAKASLVQAEDDVKVAQANLERSRKLFEAGSLARSKFEEALNQVKSAETQVDNARRQVKLMEEGARKEDIAMAKAQAEASGKQLDLARLQLEYARVTAPIGGTVVKVHVERGQSAGNTTPLVSIVSDNTIFAVVSVPELHYGAFYRKQDRFAVRVFPIAYPDQDPFPGHITRISEIIDGASRSFEMEIAVDNSKGLLKPGMYVSVQASTPFGGQTVLVPRTAVLLRNGQTVVFEAGQPEAAGLPVHMKPVRTGEKNTRSIQILEGLEAGTPVVVEGNAFLEDLQFVQPVKAE